MNWAGHVARRTENRWTTPHYVLDAPGTHREPRKTEDEMEGRFREFGKTLASYCAKRGPVEVNRKGLRLTTDIQRLKLN